MNTLSRGWEGGGGTLQIAQKEVMGRGGDRLAEETMEKRN